MWRIRAIVALLVLGTFGLLTAVAAQKSKELVFVSTGGTYQDAIREAWIKPFEKETGIKILEDTNPEIAKIKAMVDTNTVTWDVVTGGGAILAQGVQAGVFEPIPFDKVDRSQDYKNAINKYGVASEIFSTNFAFSLKAFPDGKPQPRSWADFWDVKKFPGKRAFYGRPGTSLEIALLADGVPPDQVYNLLSTKKGLDRAFAKLAELKPYVLMWWTSNSEAPVQALAAGNVVMATSFNGRFQAAIDKGVPMRMVWNGQIAQVGYEMIVKGAKHLEEAYKWLNYIASTKAQARFHNYVAYGPVTPEAWNLIPKSDWSRLPSSPQNLKNALYLNYDFWLKNEPKIMERWQAFLQE